MKLNYKNISGKLNLKSKRCKDCVFALHVCHDICRYFNYYTFTNSKEDIFDENLL